MTCGWSARTTALGPLVGHHDAAGWTRVDTGTVGDLWWAWQPRPATLPTYSLWAVGSGGRVLRYDGAAWDETVTDPALTLFGVWGATEDEVWAVGGDPSAGGAAAMFRWDGAAWSEVVLPPEAAGEDAVYKVWGSAGDDVWACGTGGLVLHYDGAAWTRVDVGTDQLLLTVAGDGPDNVVAVGGFGNARVVRFDGAAWSDESPDFVTDMNGVSVRGDAAVMVGRTGAVWSARRGRRVGGRRPRPPRLRRPPRRVDRPRRRHLGGRRGVCVAADGPRPGRVRRPPAGRRVDSVMTRSRWEGWMLDRRFSLWLAALVVAACDGETAPPPLIDPDDPADTDHDSDEPHGDTGDLRPTSARCAWRRRPGPRSRRPAGVGRRR
jgi:hypothetical protein